MGDIIHYQGAMRPSVVGAVQTPEFLLTNCVPDAHLAHRCLLNRVEKRLFFIATGLKCDGLLIAKQVMAISYTYGSFSNPLIPYDYYF